MPIGDLNKRIYKNINCRDCSMEIMPQSATQKMCPDCAAKNKIIKNRERNRKYLKNNRSRIVLEKRERRRIERENKPARIYTSWMKGLTKINDKRIAQMAINKTGKKTGPRPNRKGIRVAISTEFKKGIIPEGGFETRFKKGPGHPLWKGGITSEHAKIRQCGQYRKWRTAVYLRDNLICQICQKKCEIKDRVAHHINSFSAYEHLRFVTENGVTLCRSCHRYLHIDEEKRLCQLAI